MVYITIPALASFPDSVKLTNGTLDPLKNDMRSLLERYTVREVTLVSRVSTAVHSMLFELSG